MVKAVNHKGVPVVYNVVGSGWPLVLVHGVAEDGRVWQQQSAFLANQFQVIAIDLPGSGRSPANGSYAMEDLAEAVLAVLTAEAITQSVLVGHSMGGYVVLAFAYKYPAQVKAFGLFHSTAFADPEEKKKTRDKNIQFIQRYGTEPFLQQSTPTLFSDQSKTSRPELVPALIDQFKDADPVSLAAYQQAMRDRPDRTALLKHFVKPVLFIIGQHDNAIPFADSMKQCHLPDYSYIHILENSGHMGMLEETTKSNAILQEFLQDVYLNDPEKS